MGWETRALVTGASSGLGASLAKRLARRGHEVWLAARRVEALEALVAEIAAAGGKAHAFPLDVSQPEAAALAVEKLDEEVGGFGLVVANAGVGGNSQPFSQQTLADLRRIMETNFMGAAATILPLVPRMVARGGGHIVGVSSVAGELPLPVAVDYGTSKAAFTFFLEGAAADLESKGLHVTIIHPGFVRTAMTDKGDFEKPFMLELEDAVGIMDRAIEDKVRLVRFPLGITAAITAAMSLPRGLRHAVMKLATAKR